jgi:hypothetical protein
MVALQNLRYGGRKVRTGELFHADVRDLDILQTRKRAKSFTPIETDATPEPRRRYRRRDIQAEE